MRQILEDFDKNFYDYFMKEIEPKIIRNEKRKLIRLLNKAYRASQFINFIKKYLSEQQRIELEEIRRSKLFITKDDYPAYIVGKNVYKFVSGKDVSLEDCEEVSNESLKNIFYLNNELIHMDFSDGKMNYTSGIKPANYEYNVRTNNGNDWIKYYMFNKAEGYLYFITLEIDNVKTYKVGITKDIKSRISQLKRKCKILEVCEEKGNMLEMAIKEKAYHIKYNRQRHHLSSEFEGSNECYLFPIWGEYLSLESSIDIVVKAGYKISKNILHEIIKEQIEKA